jgi:ABC-type multidrug transport system fused ATPase/permease subunit
MIIIKQIIRILELMIRSDRRQYFFLFVSFSLVGILDVIAIYALSTSMLFLNAVQEGQSWPGDLIKEFFPGVGDSKIFLLLAMTTLLLFLLKSSVSMFLMHRTMNFLIRVGNQFAATIGRDFFSLNLTQIRSLSSAKVAHGLNYGINAMTMELLGSGLVLFGEIFLIITLLVLLLFIDSGLTIGFVAYFVMVFLLLLKRVGRLNLFYGNARIDADLAGTSAIQDLVHGYRDIFVLGKVEAALEKFGDKKRDSLKSSAKISFFNLVPKYIVELSFVFSLSIVAVVTYVQGGVDYALLTNILIFFAASTRLLPSFLRIQTALNSMKFSERTSKFIWEILDVVEMKRSIFEATLSGSDISASVTNENCGVVVSASNVSFSYGDSEFSINNLNFKIHEGEFVAFVGKSGSGKSTIVDLLIGLLEPTSGEILIKNQAPKKYLASYPGTIGLVPQDVELFNGSILDNIALFNPNPDRSHVNFCLGQAQAAQFVDLLEFGIDTIVGERGLNLSGGQRQRIGIARALYNSPQILILDEATSALDSESELAISQSIEAVSKKTTTIVVAHRLSTVLKADRLFYWSSGALLATGDFQSLRHQIPEFELQANILGL